MPKTPTELSDDALEHAQGAGRQVPAHTPEWTGHSPSDPGHTAHELTHTVQQDSTRGVWKAPAGTDASLTHDPVFEEWSKKR